MEEREKEERGGKKIRPTFATDWNERFSSLCGVLKGIKERGERGREDSVRIMS